MPPSQPRIPVLAVAGPTASGKSALAVRLARELDGEVISADSMQVYAASLSGRRSLAEARDAGRSSTHLLGFLPLEESYSVARYVEDASHAAGSIHARGRLPILCGGTGLYLQAFLDNLIFTEQGVDPALRAALKAVPSRKADRPCWMNCGPLTRRQPPACTTTIPAGSCGPSKPFEPPASL